MATWLFGKVMDKLIDNGLEYLQKQFTWRTDMKNKLERLRDNQPKIQAIVSAASQAQIIDQNPALNEWIWQLRDAIDEADDFFDEIEYIKHQQQLDRNKEETKVRSYWSNISNPAKRLRVGNEDILDLKKLEELVQKLDNILAGASVFLHLLDFKKQEQEQQLVELRKTRETGCLPINYLIGRDEAKDVVIKWLREPSNEEYQTHVTTTILYHNISILSIVGHGGMGKTTLAQYVYADEMTKEFDLKMWVCVSDSFDVKKVITDMLGFIDRSSLQSLTILQESLKSKMMSKKFLLVLDDIWDKEKEDALYTKLEKILTPLTYGSLGSKILITTRMDSVVSMIAKVVKKKKEVLRLEGLKEDDCLQVLITNAFDVGENPDDHKKLISIAQELVKKNFGSPLAAKVMGGVLSSSLDERHWRNVLNNNLELPDIFSILKLSYIFLPQHLQSCFSFCSIFKPDHLFDKDELVQMWIALGFIQPSRIQGETLTLEDIGESYFDVLIKKSFFNKVSYQNGYKMHDLLHELAQSVSTQECLRFVGDDKSAFLKIPKTIRHLSIETSNPEVLKSVGIFKNLKTLHIIDEYDSNLVDVLVEIFKVTRSIRLLHLNYSFELKMIPEEIRYLQHLRYLRYSFLNVKLLPRSLSSLYHLQFIIFDDDVNFLSNDYFPRDMNNLFNLRHLSYRSFINYCNFNFPGIGKLKLLQKLMEFNIKNEKGHRIEELEHMNEIRILKIRNLKDVRAAEDANNAKLCDKRKLTDLSLNWNQPYRNIADPNLDERVLDNLQPHNYLKTLDIQHCMGSRSAIWMNDGHLINNLEVIELSSCLNWEILPPFGQLPFLKTLMLYNMPKVKRLENEFHGNDMRCVFPSLEELRIVCMEALVDWFDASVVDCLFPCLTKLKLSMCPNMQELPYLPPKLESLKINDIGWKSLNCCSISKSIPLKTLDVRHCRNITSISADGEIGKLENLIIEDLRSLQSLPCSLRNIISSLEFVEMKMLPQLQEYPDLPLPFTKMKIKKLKPKEKMFLTIENDHGLEELEHMNEIRFLDIRYLKNVRDSKEAFNAKLCDKRKLIHLSLYWRLEELDNGDRDLDERVLDNLQPHNYLKTLDIQHYMGSRSAIWMNDAHLINNLQEIYLRGCLNWEILPPFGLFPFLKSLRLWNMPKVKRLENKFHGSDMRCVFPSLEELYLTDMEALVDWFDASVVDGLFPCLTYFQLRRCPNLQELPYLPPKLRSLEIEKIGWKTLNCCSISKSIPLQTIFIRDREDITCKLKSLAIINCPNLISLGEEHQEEVDDIENCQLILDNLIISDPSVLQMEPLRSCTSIRNLKIEYNDKLVSFPLEAEQWLLQVSSSLRELEFYNLRSLQSLPSSLSSISSLQKLHLTENYQASIPPYICQSVIVIQT